MFNLLRYTGAQWMIIRTQLTNIQEYNFDGVHLKNVFELECKQIQTKSLDQCMKQSRVSALCSVWCLLARVECYNVCLEFWTNIQWIISIYVLHTRKMRHELANVSVVAVLLSSMAGFRDTERIIPSVQTLCEVLWKKFIEICSSK